MDKLHWMLKNLSNKTVFIFGNIWMVFMVMLNAGLVVLVVHLHSPYWFCMTMAIVVGLQAAFTFVILRKVWELRKEILAKKVAA